MTTRTVSKKQYIVPQSWTIPTKLFRDYRSNSDKHHTNRLVHLKIFSHLLSNEVDHLPAILSQLPQTPEYSEVQYKVGLEIAHQQDAEFIQRYYQHLQSAVLRIDSATIQEHVFLERAFYYLSQNQPEDAYTLLKDALSSTRCGKNWLHQQYAGYIAMCMDNLTRAMPHLKAAFDMEPTQWLLYYQCLLQAGHIEQIWEFVKDAELNTIEQLRFHMMVLDQELEELTYEERLQLKIQSYTKLVGYQVHEWSEVKQFILEISDEYRNEALNLLLVYMDNMQEGNKEVWLYLYEEFMFEQEFGYVEELESRMPFWQRKYFNRTLGDQMLMMEAEGVSEDELISVFDLVMVKCRVHNLLKSVFELREWRPIPRTLSLQNKYHARLRQLLLQQQETDMQLNNYIEE